MGTKILDAFGRDMDPDDKFAKKSQPIVDDVRGEFLVSEREVDPETGDFIWTASPTNPDDQMQELRFRIPRNAADRGQLSHALENKWDLTTMHLVRREGSAVFDVLAITPALTDKDRQVFDAHGHAYTWTKELDTKVTEYFHHSIQKRVMQGQSELLNDPDSGSILNPRARDIFVSQMQALGDKRPTDELGRLYDSDITSELEGSRSSYADMLQGRQLNDKGQVEKCFFNPVMGFADHGIKSTNPKTLATSVANYAAQRACYEYLHTYSTQPIQTKGGLVSPLAFAETELVSSRSLFGFHPNRSPEDHEKLTTEFAERITMMTVQGMSQACGAKAVDPKFDHVTPTNKSERDPSGNPYTIHSHMHEHIVGAGLMPSFAEHEAQNGDPTDWLKRYSTQFLANTQEHLDAKEAAIAGEMDKSMANGRQRIADPDETLRKRLEHGALLEKGVSDTLKDIEEAPEIV